jgi:thiamine biosynthesis lipoprotein
MCAAKVLDEFDRLERILTIYDAQSEVSRLNRMAHGGPIPLSIDVLEVLLLAQRLSDWTGGAFDVTSGHFSKVWGFVERRPRLPSEESLAAAQLVVGMGHLRLDLASQTLWFDTPGVEINLGSIGKGYALDRGADILLRESVKAALLDAGRSSVLAIGYPAGEERGWLVGIVNPRCPQSQIARIWLRDRALATSAASFQFIEHNGRRLGHIIDPRTGWPAEGIDSATVLAPTAAEADALSTAFYIMGIDAARTFCATHHGISAIMVPADGATVTIGMPAASIDWISGSAA